MGYLGDPGMADPGADSGREDLLVAAAANLGHALGESGREPLRQLRRLLRFCGLGFAEELLAEAQGVESAGGLATKDGAGRRTFGGVFFRLARDRLYSSDRAAFYRIFQSPKKTPREVHWDERPRGPGLPLAGKGEVRNVKITVTGRPEGISQGQGFVVLAMVSRKPPTLPRGLPSPRPASTSYAVYVTEKQWSRVASVAADPTDFLIVEGYPHLDAEERSIAVFANKVTTRSLEAVASKKG
jgi:hypothetical protein